MSLYQLYHQLFSFGIKGKLSFLFLLSSILPFFLIGYYGYYSTSQALIENTLETDKQHVSNLINGIQGFLDVVPGDLKFVTNLHALEKFFLWQDLGEPYQTKQALKDSRNALYSLLANRKSYSRLQLLNHNGQELLRIEYDSRRDKTSIVPQHELQDFRSSPYFSQILSLKKDEIYFSDLSSGDDTHLDLATVVRYATPIVDPNNVTQGALILSVPIDNFLEPIRLAQEDISNNSAFHYVLVTQSGEYLFPPEKRPDKRRNSSHLSLSLEFPILFKATHENSQGLLQEQGIILTYQQFFPLFGMSNYWVLIKQTNEDVAMTRVQRFSLMFALTMVGLLIFVFFITHWLTQLLVQPLLQINFHLKALAQGQVLEDHISYQKSDEIGELATSVWQVKNSIKNTIAQAHAIAAGNYNHQVQLLSTKDELGRALTQMTRTLREVSTQNAKQVWLKSGQTQLNDKMSSEQDLTILAQNIIHFLCTYLQSHVGVLYLVEETNRPQTPRYLKMVGSYAYTRRKNLANEFQLGEGLVGQAALERQPILITQVPPEYVPIQSGLGEATPRNIVVIPCLYENQLKGVIELGAFTDITDNQLEFLTLVAPSIGIAIHTAQSRFQMQLLLQQTQSQAEELQSQTEELQSQQEELRQANEELGERTTELEQQRNEIRNKNLELEKAQTAMEIKARELELASKYKSEFLANMSHELRTPLNSLLILAQLLAENKDKNLSDKQLDYARTIQSAGSDLLTLINEILDLSKVEAGKVEAYAQEVLLSELLASIEQKFRQVAQEKGLEFQVTVAQDVPSVICNDEQRLKQIINNLLSNAFKFTSQGSVKVDIKLDMRYAYNTPPQYVTRPPIKILAISVIDTGIGIPKDKQQVIFEAFQQADGTTSRRYGGTGLGLTISRQLAQLLGGEIRLYSEEGKGSNFTLYIPETLPNQKTTKSLSSTPERSPKCSQFSPQAEVFQADKKLETWRSKILESDETAHETPEVILANTHSEEIQDDRNHLRPEDKFILIIEDDRKFSNILFDLAHEKGFKCLRAEDGKAGLLLAEAHKPHAIVLDVGLPKIDGWTVMEKLKDNPDTRHIPVHFMSASNHRMDAKKMGAIGYLLKPINMSELGEAFKKIEQFITDPMKHLLVVADNDLHQQKIVSIASGEQVHHTLVNTKQHALEQLQTTEFDCIILDLEAEQDTGLEFLEQLRQEDRLSQIPVILYADRELSLAEENLLQRYTDNLTVKTVRSPERLLDEATLFLHQVEANLTSEKRQMLQMVHDKSAILANKRVLIVDDDIRNTFALTTILEEKNMEILVAKTGKEALHVLNEHPDVDIVLMDIMMPEMDGYEAIQKIRLQEHFRKLPILALTAKAMKGDKAKCIEAGASDYLSKPVDTDKLISLMRVWLYR